MARKAETMADLGQEIRGPTRTLSRLVPRIERLSRERSVFLQSLHDDRLRLAGPLAVFVEDDGHQVIASSADLEVFGYGETEAEALEDLRRTICDLYVELQERPRDLGPLPQRVWDYLSEVVFSHPCG